LAHHGIELFPDLAGDRTRPAGADLAHVDEIFAFPLPEIERSNPGRVFDEPDDRESALLDGFDFQPALVPIGAIRCLGVLGNDPLEIQFSSVLEHLLPVAGQVFGIDDREPDIIFTEGIRKHLLAFNLGELAEIPIPPEKVEGVIDQPVLIATGKFGLEF
jgi:hypothetical protein